MQMMERLCERQAELDALLGREFFEPMQFTPQRLWPIGLRDHASSASMVISQLHDVIKVSCSVVATNLKDFHEQPFVLARNPVKFLEP
jgi:hypothetical protein